MKRRRFTATARRGLTFLELMLALTITAMVALAISGMMGAVTSGVGTQKDNRDVMLRSHAVQTRLASYVIPARCILAQSATSLVVWLNDNRESGSVHVSEVRWLIYDDAEGTLDVYFVAFPAAWSDTAQRLEDKEFPANANWDTVLATYEALGHIQSMTLVDGLTEFMLNADGATPAQTRHIFFETTYAGANGPVKTSVASTIRFHHTPER